MRKIIFQLDILVYRLFYWRWNERIARDTKLRNMFLNHMSGSKMNNVMTEDKPLTWQMNCVVCGAVINDPDDKCDDWSCQQLHGGTGSAIYSNVNGMCTHQQCKPE